MTGNPSDTLEYLVVITNASAGAATDVKFEDTLPNFTTYVTSSTAVDTNGDFTFDHTLPADETDGEGSAGGIVIQSGSTLQVFPGIGGDETTPLTGGGSVAGSAATAVRYQVTID